MLLGLVPEADTLLLRLCVAAVGLLAVTMLAGWGGLVVLNRLAVRLIIHRLARVARRLTRPGRTAASLRFRGHVALALAVSLAVLVGTVVDQVGSLHPVLDGLGLSLALLAGLGIAYPIQRLHGILDALAERRLDKARATASALIRQDRALPDSHGLVRLGMEDVARASLTRLAGPTVALVLGGVPGVLFWLVAVTGAAAFAQGGGRRMAAAAMAWRRRLGWPALTWLIPGLCGALALIPGASARKGLQGLFQPLPEGAHGPEARMLAMVAGSTNVALGGQPWIGPGSAQVGAVAAVLTIALIRAASLVCAVGTLALAWLVLYVQAP